MMSKHKTGGKTESRSTQGRQCEEALFLAIPPRAELPEDYAEILREIKRRIQ
ncbi:MAG: hypothetical protein AB1743_06125 [Actinomycetota bacterium]